jgi:membrane associated rhomboid family serine protease
MVVTRWVLRLIVANILMYLLTISSEQLYTSLVFIPMEFLARPWTIITYMFLHGSPSHIFFNMLALFFFGPRLELELGSKYFLWLYFVSGVMGALLSFAFSPFTPIIGASGAIYGVMMGFAFLWPREKIYIWAVFPMEARWLVVVMTALSLFGGFGGTEEGIAHFAHLGGFLGGYLYMKVVEKSLHQARAQVPVVTPVLPDRNVVERWAKIDREHMHIVNREEYDRIINKIKTIGISSLTQQEIAFLNRFSERG